MTCIYCLLSCVWTIHLWALTSIDVCLYIHFIYKYTVQKMNCTSRISPYPDRRQVADKMYICFFVSVQNVRDKLYEIDLAQCTQMEPDLGFPPCNQWKKFNSSFSFIESFNVLISLKYVFAFIFWTVSVDIIFFIDTQFTVYFVNLPVVKNEGTVMSAYLLIISLFLISD